MLKKGLDEGSLHNYVYEEMDDPVMKINQNHEISLSVIHIPCLLNQTEIDRVFPGPY